MGVAARAWGTWSTWGAVALVSLGSTAPALAQTGIEGLWRTEKAAEVRIAPCPEGLCGTLAKIVLPPGETRADGTPASPETLTDVHNSDPALRDRPMLGLQIVTLTGESKPGVFAGTVYNPQDGKTYEGFVELKGPDTLRLNGCLLFNVVCRGEDWVRVGP